jgi:high-affinity iron transporter
MIMAITMLKMDRAKAKWRLKLQKAFEGKSESAESQPYSIFTEHRNPEGDGSARTERWILFFLPFITVLREGTFLPIQWRII